MDDLATQKRFAESLKLPFPLLADPDGTVARAFGVENADAHYASRVTFVIARGKVVKVLEDKDAIDPTGALGACAAGKGTTL